MNHSEPLSLGALDVNMRPLLDHNAKLLNGRLMVRSDKLMKLHRSRKC